MQPTRIALSLFSMLCLASLSACESSDDASDSGSDGSGDAAGDGCDISLTPSGGDDTTQLQTALIEIADGGTICLGAGTFSVATELSLAVNNVTVIGAGEDQTIIDFHTQTVGANGLKVTSDHVRLEAFQVFDTPGDSIRADQVDDITFNHVKVVWPDDASLQNGAYGLYPVGCNGVLIDGSTVTGARDAGIYVGQSQNIVVQNSVAYGNVAGIEIENCTDAEVRNNHAYDNTSGILIFNLPGLTRYGRATNVHDNLIENNNKANFAKEGTIVKNVPPGSGMIVLADDGNEIHHNTITGNGSLGIVLFTYQPGIFGSYTDANYNQYSTGNYIHDNTFSGNGEHPQGALPAIIPNLPSPAPDIIFDGCADPAEAPPVANCTQNNGNATFFYVDFCNNFASQSSDPTPYDCSYPALPTNP